MRGGERKRTGAQSLTSCALACFALRRALPAPVRSFGMDGRTPDGNGRKEATERWVDVK